MSVRPQEIPTVMQAIRDCVPLFAQRGDDLYGCAPLDTFIAMMTEDDEDDALADVLVETFDTAVAALPTAGAQAPRITGIPAGVFDMLRIAMARDGDVGAGVIIVSVNVDGDIDNSVAYERAFAVSREGAEELALADTVLEVVHTFSTALVDHVRAPAVDTPFLVDDTDVDEADETMYTVTWNFAVPAVMIETTTYERVARTTTTAFLPAK